MTLSYRYQPEFCLLPDFPGQRSAMLLWCSTTLRVKSLLQMRYGSARIRISTGEVYVFTSRELASIGPHYKVSR